MSTLDTNTNNKVDQSSFKIVAPKSPEVAVRQTRMKKIDYSELDHIGHGVVQERQEPLSSSLNDSIGNLSQDSGASGFSGTIKYRGSFYFEGFIQIQREVWNEVSTRKRLLTEQFAFPPNSFSTISTIADYTANGIASFSSSQSSGKSGLFLRSSEARRT